MLTSDDRTVKNGLKYVQKDHILGHLYCCTEQAVYTVLREAEDRSVAPIPIWEIPIWKDVSPRQRKVKEALKLINGTLDDLIAICKVIFFVITYKV